MDYAGITQQYLDQRTVPRTDVGLTLFNPVSPGNFQSFYSIGEWLENRAIAIHATVRKGRTKQITIRFATRLRCVLANS
jgi:hypothetical protein